MNKFFILGLIACGVSAFAMQESVAKEGCGGCCTPVPSREPTAALTEAEAADLLLMREEEKLARDVYNAMHERYNQPVFINIPRAEQFHMDAILGLLKSYDLKDPVKQKPGKFRNAELQKLYNDLVARGMVSQQEAFLAGALVEEVDIADLLDTMKRTDKEDLLAVYGNLLGGSKRHLNAFVRNYEAVSGKPYMAQKLPQSKIDGILGR